MRMRLLKGIKRITRNGQWVIVWVIIVAVVVVVVVIVIVV